MSTAMTLLGPANRVTCARLLGTIVVAGILAAQVVREPTIGAMIAMIGIGAVSLALDGVDGHVARSRGVASAFGARFDVEADTLLLLVLSVAVAALDITGWWVLAIGLLRYGYLLASHLHPALRIPLPASRARKAVAVTQGVALLLALSLSVVPGLPAWLPTPLLIISLAALGWSFARDVRWQVRTHVTDT